MFVDVEVERYFEAKVRCRRNGYGDLELGRHVAGVVSNEVWSSYCLLLLEFLAFVPRGSWASEGIVAEAPPKGRGC